MTAKQTKDELARLNDGLLTIIHLSSSPLVRRVATCVANGADLRDPVQSDAVFRNQWQPKPGQETFVLREGKEES